MLLTARLALINLAGIALFLAVASHFWVEPELASEPGFNLGDAFGWLIFAAPILALFAIGNIVWLVAIVRAMPSQWRSALLVFALMGGLWIGAFVFDGRHHGV